MKKVLVANRGEIAVRVIRAAHELGLATVAIYTPEDQLGIQRSKARESYVIGEPGHPVRGYLDVDAIIEVALRSGADAIHPGYGFLSESPALADACVAAGITFVGPPASVLRLTGDKVSARDAAERAGLPVLKASRPLTADGGVRRWTEAADEVGYPLFVKASAGGGGRGLRVVSNPSDLIEAVASATREAAAAFGDGTVFLEQAVVRPRHIEVQVLFDQHGHGVHLFERDCSVQRRHQKVVELAPAPHLDPRVAYALHTSALQFAREVDYVNAGTVEFLVGPDGVFTFMEMNPRIQVEHTVTEEVTGIDLVVSQLRIAAGETLADIGVRQERLRVRGFAIQCRITTEDPAAGFRPDTGTVSSYQSPGGPGIRLDGSVYSGAEITPYFDSLLVKLTTRGNDLERTAMRARRALGEFRVRGVRTNIPFLRRLLAEPDFLAGGVSTAYLEEHPELAQVPPATDRISRLLVALGESTVNGLERPDRPLRDPLLALPAYTPAREWSPSAAEPGPEVASGDHSRGQGSRWLLDEVGPVEWARRLRAQTALAVTDTTMRDAHQSLLATRVRTTDLVAAAPAVQALLPELLSLECWGGATYDVALRFLHEDPWDRLARLREAAPGILLQMLLRGRNAVGYTPYPDRVVQAFVDEAASTGVDLFRVFDALNDIEQMRPALRAVQAAGKIAEGTLCYTGDLADPAEQLYTLDYYLRLAADLVEAGSHALCIKDMAGLLRPHAATLLVTALRSEFDLPVHLHTHDTTGGQLATLVAAANAGVDAVDGAQAPWSGGTSQVNLSALVAATDHTGRSTGLSLAALNSFEPYWEVVRDLYAPFEAGLRAPTGTVYRHEIPGGQLTNLRQQAIGLGLGDRWEDVQELYAVANEMLGKPIKVTPTSKVVGDLALFLAGVDVEKVRTAPQDFDLPASVLGYLAGELGTPPAGFPEPFRTLATQGRVELKGEVALTAEDEASLDDPAQRRDTLSRLLFPGPWADFEKAFAVQGDVTVIPTEAFFYGLELGRAVTLPVEPGRDTLVELDTVGEIDEDGMRTLYVRINGQPRTLQVRDTSVVASKVQARRATAGDPAHVGSPLPGVVMPKVAVGDRVTKGQALAVVEAMKMESTVSSPTVGVVIEVVVTAGTSVEPGDLLFVLG